MELSQLEQMIRWLDDERKKDKLLIVALEERLEQQNELLANQAKEITSLHQDITTLRADLRMTEDYPAMIEKTHRDLSGMVEEMREVARRERTESERLRRTEMESFSAQVTDLEKRLRVFNPIHETLKAHAADTQRLQTQMTQIVNSLADLTKRTDDRLQTIVYLEEQRRGDTRRIAAVEGEIPPLRKAYDEINARHVRLEDSVRKLPARVEEAIQIAKSYDPRIEELRVADFQREQRMKQYVDQAEKVNAELGKMLEQTQRYALLYNQNKQALDGLEAFQVRLDKRQNEAAEMQRLADERLRRQWEEWQANFARDWQKRVVTEEDRWRRQDLTNQKVVEQSAEFGEQATLYYQQIVALWEELRSRHDPWVQAAREIAQASTKQPTEQIKALRKFAEEKHKELL